MTKKARVPNIFYILSTLSYLPVVGIIIGIILLIVVNKEKFDGKKIINTVIIVGILSSFAFYFFISKTYIWGNVYNHPTTVKATQKVTRLVDKIEAYKNKYGHFPKTLHEISDKAIIVDPVQTLIENQDTLFYYQLDKDQYYLFSRGFDRKPFTSDDIFPNIKCENKGDYRLINCRKKKKRRK